MTARKGPPAITQGAREPLPSRRSSRMLAPGPGCTRSSRPRPDRFRRPRRGHRWSRSPDRHRGGRARGVTRRAPARPGLPELGSTDYPVVVRRGLSEAEKIEHALKLNLLAATSGPSRGPRRSASLARGPRRRARAGQEEPSSAAQPRTAVMAAELGVDPRTARRRLRVADRLAPHPDLAAKVDAGARDGRPPSRSPASGRPRPGRRLGARRSRPQPTSAAATSAQSSPTSPTRASTSSTPTRRGPRPTSRSSTTSAPSPPGSSSRTAPCCARSVRCSSPTAWRS